MNGFLNFGTKALPKSRNLANCNFVGYGIMTDNEVTNLGEEMRNDGIIVLNNGS
jgi:hypothetical protein